MNPQQLAIDGRDLADGLVFAFLAFGAALIVVPPVVFGIARRMAREQPQLAGAAIGGAVALSLGALAATTLLLLVLLGWLPPPAWGSTGGG